MASKKKVSTDVLEKQKTEQMKIYYMLFTIVIIYLGFLFGGAENSITTSTFLGSHKNPSVFEVINVAVSEPLGLFPLSFYHLKWTAGFLVCYAIYLVWRYTEYLRFKESRPNETHGTSKWNEDYEGFAEKYTASITETCHNPSILDKLSNFKEEDVVYTAPQIDMNLMFTQKNKLSFDNKKTRRNSNTVILGGSGTGKSFSFIEPNIAQLNSSYVVTDPSGEIYQNMYKLLRDNGYVVKVLNLKYYDRGNHYNPFDYIRRKEDGTCDQTSVMAMVESFINNAGGAKEEQFWKDSANALFCAAAFFLIETRPYKDWTMANVSKIIRQAKKDENSSSSSTGFDLMMQKAGAKNPDSMAYSFYQTFKLASAKTAESILVTTDVKLSKFSIPEVKALTTTDLDDIENNVNLTSIGDRKTALFIITQTGGGPCDFLASMLYSQLFDIVYDRCESFVPTKQHIYSNNGYPLETMFHSTEEAEKRIEEIKSATIKQDGDTKKWYLTKTVDGKERTIWDRYTSMNKDIDVFHKDKRIEFVSKRQAEDFIDEFKTAVINTGDNRTPWAITCLLDEFNNITEIPKFDQILATCRKYNLNISIVLQNLAQLKARYKDAWNTILGNCDNFLFLGSSELDTCKYVSDILGDGTIISKSASRQAGNTGQANYSFSNMARKLLNPTELAQLDNDMCIYVMRGEMPFKAPKIDFTKHVNFKATGCGSTERQMLEPEMKLLYTKKKKKVRRRRKKVAVAQAENKPTEVKNVDDVLEATNSYTEEEAVKNTEQPKKPAQNSVESIQNLAKETILVDENGAEEYAF